VTNRKGFTLMEIIVTTMLGALLLLTISVICRTAALISQRQRQTTAPIDGDLTMNTILHGASNSAREARS